ncbi:polysaccharide deacetylase [Gemmatimonadota bacterium]
MSATSRHPIRARALALFLPAWLVLCLGLPSCRRPDVAAELEEPSLPRPGWEWREEEVWEAVNAVRAGRNLQPATWPSGARVAVLLSFDVDNETIALRYGEPTIGSLSQGEYGARVALGRILNLLDRHQIPASFFVPAWSLKISPEMAQAIAEPGRHEFAVHGWIHEMNSSLPLAQERDLLVRSIDYLTEVTGERPVGYRAPSWNFSPNTLDLLLDLGFLYDSSLMADDRPYEIEANGSPTGMVELPVEWILDDAPLLNPLGTRYSPPREVLQVYKDEFDKAYEEGTMFLLTMHPHYIGHRSRMVILEGLIDHIRTREDVWFATHRKAAEWVRAQAGME